MDLINSYAFNYTEVESTLPDVVWGDGDIWSYGEEAPKPKAYITIPACSCDYIRWMAKDMGFKYPYLGNDLHPTKQLKDCCQYCGYFVCWVRVDVKNFESKDFPLWANIEYFNKVAEKTWFTRYIDAVERVKANRKLDDVDTSIDTL